MSAAREGQGDAAEPGHVGHGSRREQTRDQPRRADGRRGWSRRDRAGEDFMCLSFFAMSDMSILVRGATYDDIPFSPV